MTDDDAAKIIETQLQGFINEDEGYVPGVDYILCRVEGCPRTTPVGQVERCGLSNVLGFNASFHSPYCGSRATVDMWIEKGLLNF